MIFVRLALSGTLLFLAYKETGPITTIILTSMTISAELTSYTIRNLIKCIKELNQRL